MENNNEIRMKRMCWIREKYEVYVLCDLVNGEDDEENGWINE